MAKLRIGSRGSQLALWQSRHVAQALEARGHSVDIKTITTTGDRNLDVALSQVGTKGMFTKEIEEALADGSIDLAIHSLKDLPTELMPEFAIAAVLAREDPRDAFVSSRFTSLAELPQGARVGTSSLRRQAQLKALRPDLDLRPLRGNVDTRLRKLEAGECDAVILAHAGLLRLGRTEHVRQLLKPRVMCPAAGQGALAVEIRSADAATRSAVAFLDDAASRAATTCERAALNALGGGCQVPIGAFAQAIQPAGTLQLDVVVARPDGSEVLRADDTGTDPEELGRELGLKMLDMGARDILADVHKSGLLAPEQP